MGTAVIKAADSAGVNVVPVSFGSAEECGQILQVHGKDILVHGPADREKVLASVFDEHPNLIVVDYTVPSAVNGNYYGTYYLEKKGKNRKQNHNMDFIEISFVANGALI